MGNSNTKPNIEQEKINTKAINSIPIKSNLPKNEEEIFQKIVTISNQLLSEYNNEYLNQDFCNKLAIIYQKKLSNFNIKLLRAMNDKINSNEVDNEFLMEFQYMPKNAENDKFFVEILSSIIFSLFEKLESISICNISKYPILKGTAINILLL